MKLADIILHEDDSIIIINKPAGLTVHPDGKTKFETLSEMLIDERPEMKTVGEPLTLDTGEIIIRPGIVHRLDRDTSGVMVIAKTDNAYKSLKNQFQEHSIKKHYKAIVVGTFRSPRGIIKEPIGRSNLDIRKWAAGVHARGEKRDAITRYMAAFSGKAVDAKGDTSSVTVLDVYPETGRTHQIRVHLQYIQHPIIGDSLYASYVPEMLGMKRQALHAEDITIVHPESCKSMRYAAPMPEDMQNAIKLIEE